MKAGVTQHTSVCSRTYANTHTQMLKDMVMHLEDPGVKTKVIEREVEIYQSRKIPRLVLKERQSRKFSSLGLYVHRDYALKRLQRFRFNKRRYTT